MARAGPGATLALPWLCVVASLPHLTHVRQSATPAPPYKPSTSSRSTHNSNLNPNPVGHRRPRRSSPITRTRPHPKSMPPRPHLRWGPCDAYSCPINFSVLSCGAPRLRQIHGSAAAMGLDLGDASVSDGDIEQKNINNHGGGRMKGISQRCFLLVGVVNP
jgi:hypothetical protein